MLATVHSVTCAMSGTRRACPTSMGAFEGVSTPSSHPELSLRGPLTHRPWSAHPPCLLPRPRRLGLQCTSPTNERKAPSVIFAHDHPLLPPLMHRVSDNPARGGLSTHLIVWNHVLIETNVPKSTFDITNKSTYAQDQQVQAVRSRSRERLTAPAL